GEKITVAPASYVYRTAVSAALDLMRRRRALREDPCEWLEDGIAAGAASRPDRAIELEEAAEQLARCLAALPASRRVVVRMHLLGYHRREIAEQLGWTEAKTRNLLYRGLADLKALLSDGRGETGTG
ncbi:MAG TPA: RNA polymerase sigma factor, partial [Gemmatimonadota bacterium]|nr:RNA polymerase sigma factor [Gemmatimonadota bacterium]